MIVSLSRIIRAFQFHEAEAIPINNFTYRHRRNFTLNLKDQ